MLAYKYVCNHINVMCLLYERVGVLYFMITYSTNSLVYSSTHRQVSNLRSRSKIFDNKIVH